MGVNGSDKSYIGRTFQEICRFSGRAQRAEYWWFALFSAIVYFGSYFFIELILNSVPFFGFDVAIIEEFVSLVILLILFTPSIAVEVRRLHDRNMAGSWAIVWAALLIILFLSKLMIFLPVDYYVHYFIGTTQTSETTVYFLLVFFSITFNLLFGRCVILILLLFRGTRGQNRYGPDPLDPSFQVGIFQ
ncbi:DUF805 domain-containing protein [Bartonella sp. HY329]|uniref:DUF805 domain-containing protein n=1 Tax=unclassified Bartonella TaxID=2645622 RepID=UPI0021C80C02|nr:MULTISPECIES: DUF805 domain-containing protein [unclassified Bartonella]UXM95994.1 DUF805 domain-containing protein [Bartonella sp. HY329]UXN10319.1 DUF805 domain-containing protein [Bartonella sp. HY328]